MTSKGPFQPKAFCDSVWFVAVSAGYAVSVSEQQSSPSCV